MQPLQVPRGYTGQQRKLASVSNNSQADIQGGTDIMHGTPTIVEQQITDLWQHLFAIDSIAVDADFFELGGDSLLLLQVSVHLEAIFGVRISLSHLVATTTISEISELVTHLMICNVDNDTFDLLLQEIEE